MKTPFSPVVRFLLALIIFLSSVGAAPLSQTLTLPTTDTAQILEDLGGYPCSEDSAFTCVTIDVRLDHFNPDDTRTIPVVFAVLPASGARKGMFVVSTGGPGLSGVLSADYYSSGYDLSIFESFDIVFFDQRGIGLSGGLTCPFATEYYQQTPERHFNRKALAPPAPSYPFVVKTDPELLPYLGTKQAVEDLEIFRQIIGDDKFWLYGESYGTQYAQTYAAAHGEHLAGLIQDGTVDLTYNGFEYYAQQAQAYNDVLVATLSACNDDPACAEQANGDAIAAYHALLKALSNHPISFRFLSQRADLKSENLP
jgi:pimeloyl-ACP methyl ester carboxylesterase